MAERVKRGFMPLKSRVCLVLLQTEVSVSWFEPLLCVNNHKNISLLIFLVSYEPLAGGSGNVRRKMTSLD